MANAPKSAASSNSAPHLHAPRAKVILAFAAIYLIWGSTYLAIKIAIATIPPLFVAATRFLTAGLLLHVFARLRTSERPTRVHWRNAAIIGNLLFLAGTGALTWSEQYVPSGLAALLLAIIPLWMVLLHHLEIRRGLGWPLILGLALGLAGIALLVGPQELLGGARIPLVGASVLVVGSICWSVGSLQSRHVTMPKSSLLAASMEMLAGGAGLVVIGLVTGEGRELIHASMSARSALGVAYLVVFGSILGFNSYHWLLKVSTPSRVATYAYVNPVIAILLGWSFGGEAMNLRTLLATIIIVAAVAIIITHQARAEAAKDLQELPASGELPETVV